MRRKIRQISQLLLGLAGVLLFLVAANSLSDSFPLIEETRRTAIEADAYFYSEVGELNEFLDDEKGRYGAASLDPTAENAERIITTKTQRH